MCIWVIMPGGVCSFYAFLCDSVAYARVYTYYVHMCDMYMYGLCTLCGDVHVWCVHAHMGAHGYFCSVYVCGARMYDYCTS